MSPNLTLGCVLAAFVAASGCDAQARPIAPPTRPFLVVANQRSGVATLVELSSGRVSNVDLGLKPHEVAVSPDGRIAVLTIPSETFRRGRKVVVLDLATVAHRTITLDGYNEPHGIAFLSDSVALIGTLAGTSAVYVDVRNERVLRAVHGFPANPYIVKLASTGRAYVSSPTSSKVSEVDVAAARITRRFDIPNDPSGIAVSPDGKELYSGVWTDRGDGGIVVFDLEKGAIATKLPARQPRRITVTADGRVVVASDRDQMHLIDRATRQVRSVFTGTNAGGSGVTCSPDSTRCYVALSQAGEIVEIDVVAARVLRRFAAQPGADGIAYAR